MATDNDIIVQRNEPPRYGYRSYAHLVKVYCVYGMSTSYRRTQGSFEFGSYYHRHESIRPYGWNSELMFHFMKLRGNGDHYVLKVFPDGTALYRPRYIAYMRFPARDAIRKTIDYFFYQERTIEEDRYNNVLLLRRKPVNKLSQLYSDSNNFHSFLTSKYNK